MIKLQNTQIKSTYDVICDYYNRHLKSQGVKLPRLKISGKYTRDALILVYLAQGYPQTKIVSKLELTQFIRQYYPNTITRLQKAHMDPNKPLVAGNIIPQCGKCNRADRNNWVYDERGRVIKVANPKVIKRSDKDIIWGIYKLLYQQFKGVNPNE